MILWRGWGILAFFAIGIAVGLTALLAMASGTNMDGVTWQGLPAFVIVGVGVYFLGNYLNVSKPTKDFERARGQYFTAQHNPVNSLGGAPEPLPFDQQPPLSDEERKSLRGIKNRHTLFFIPMQWWGVILPLLGLGISLASMN